MEASGKDSHSEADYCCNHASGRCRSCGLIDRPYLEQLKIKEKRLAELFSGTPFGTSKLTEVVPCEQPLGSRNKAKMVVAGFAHQPIIGLPDAAQLGEELLDCPLHKEPINNIVACCKQLISQCGISPYNVAKRRGELKHLIVRHAASSNQSLVRLVLRSKKSLERVTRMAAALRNSCPSVAVVSVNLQPQHAAILEGEEEFYLTEQQTICERIGSVDIVYNSQSFSQITTDVAEKLYAEVSKEIAARQCQSLLDLYCGSGAFLLSAASNIERGVGVEISAQAVEMAKSGASLNGFDNLEFIAGDVGGLARSELRKNFAAAVLNPPRRGLSAEITGTLLEHGPRVIFYSSCNPETLKRDLLELSNGYELEQLKPFDMFPFTEHVEVLATLVRRA